MGVSSRGTRDDTSSDHVRISIGESVLHVDWLFVPEEEEVWEAVERVGSALSVAVDASTASSRLGVGASTTTSFSSANLTVFLGVGVGVLGSSSSSAKRTVFMGGVVADMPAG